MGILFYGGWSIAKWFLDKTTQEKVQPMLYLTGVQQFIADEFIPTYMVRKKKCHTQLNSQIFSDPFFCFLLLLAYVICAEVVPSFFIKK